MNMDASSAAKASQQQQQQQHSELLTTLLSDVRRFAAQQQQQSSSDDIDFEGRLLATKITDTFRLWARRCASNHECALTDSAAAAAAATEAHEEEIQKVGDACMTLLNTRLLSQQRRHPRADSSTSDNSNSGYPELEQEQHDDDDGQQQQEDDGHSKTSIPIDPIVRLVLDCAKIFFCDEASAAASSHALFDIKCASTSSSSSSSSSSPLLRTSSAWRSLVVSLCERKAEPLELSLKGYKFLAACVSSAAKKEEEEKKKNNNNNSAMMMMMRGGEQQQQEGEAEQAKQRATILLLLDALGFTDQRNGAAATDGERALVEGIVKCHTENSSGSAHEAAQQQQQQTHPADAICNMLFKRDNGDTPAARSSPIVLLLLTRVTRRALRCSGVLHETFSNASSRRFCQATHFDSVLGAILIQHIALRDNSNSNSSAAAASRDSAPVSSSTLDVLTHATLFTSIAHAVNCCGPAALSLTIATEIGKFLAFPAAGGGSSRSNRRSSGNDADDGDAINAQILRPFAHHALAEMLQRGTVADEEHQRKEQERRRKRAKKDEEETRKRKLAGAAVEEKKSNNTGNNIVDEDDASSDENPWRKQNNNDNNNKIAATFAPLLDALLGQVSAHVLTQSDNRDDVDNWVRSVTALFSSPLGVAVASDFLASKQKKEKGAREQQQQQQQSKTAIATPPPSPAAASGAAGAAAPITWCMADVAATTAAIVRAMLRASSSNISARITGLNAIQSCAVGLSSGCLLALSGEGDEQQPSASFFYLDFISSILAAMLHGTKIDGAVSFQQQQAAPEVTGFFGKIVFPLGRGVGNTASEPVQEAFWTMIEQLVVAPPVAAIHSGLAEATAAIGKKSADADDVVIGNNNNNNNNTNEKKKKKTMNAAAQLFLQRFVIPVIAPMCPSLVSMLCTTSQKDLGLSLYQRRRPLASALLRYETLCRKWIEMEEREEADDDEGEESNGTTSSPAAMVCGCSAMMWENLRNSLMIDGGGGGGAI